MAASRRRKVPIEEIVLGLALASAPLIVYLFGKAVTGVFVWRYAIGGVIGIAMLFGFSCFRLFRGSALAAWTVILVVATSFAVKWRLTMHDLSVQRLSLRSLLRRIDLPGNNLEPLVIGDSGMFYLFSYYSSPEMKGRFVYLVDLRRSLKILGHDTPDRSLSALYRWFGLNIKPYDSYVDAHPVMTVCTSLDTKWDWLLYALIDDGKKISIKGRIGSVLLFSARNDQVER